MRIVLLVVSGVKDSVVVQFEFPQTKAPRTRLSQGRSFEQPSPEVCSVPAYVLDCPPIMARTGYCIGGSRVGLLIHRVSNSFLFLWKCSSVGSEASELSAQRFNCLPVRGELTHLYDTTSGIVTEAMVLTGRSAGHFLLASRLLVVVPGKRLWVPRESLPQILHSLGENVYSDRYQPQDVVFFWLGSKEGLWNSLICCSSL